MSSFTSFPDSSFHRFLDNLVLSLDLGTKLRVYHISTPPVATTPIFAPAPGRPDEATTCESHFLTISQPHVITSANADPTDSLSTNDHAPGTTASHVLVLGIEVLVFSTDSLTTIFVSKADSTGFLSRPAASTQGSSSIIKVAVSAFLDWLVTRQLSSAASGPTDVTDHGLVTQLNDDENSEIRDPDISGRSGGGGGGGGGSTRRRKRLVLSLFARSQNQYLFPGSIENTTKHVLDDRQLIKWWCRVLDGLVQRDRDAQSTLDNDLTIDPGCGSAESASSSYATNVKISTNAYVVVPGCDRTETIRSFFPPSARYPQAENEPKWHNSYPVHLLVQQEQIPAKPSLPARCLIPRLPDDPKARYCDDLDGVGTDDNGEWKNIRSLQQFWEMMEYRQECAAGRLVGFVWVVFDSIAGSSHGEVERCTEKDVTHTTTRSETVASGSLESVQQMTDPIQSSHGSVLLTNEQYIVLSDLLINTTDFAGAELAVKSTNEWVDKVKELSGFQRFGIEIEGKRVNGPAISGPVSMGAKTIATAGSKHSRDESSTRVNVLTGVRRKKQKVVSETPSNNAENTTTANGHGIPTMEPKSKTEKQDDKVDNADGTNGVKTLSAGLVRKKPKPAVS